MTRLSVPSWTHWRLRLRHRRLARALRRLQLLQEAVTLQEETVRRLERRAYPLRTVQPEPPPSPVSHLPLPGQLPPEPEWKPVDQVLREQAAARVIQVLPPPPEPEPEILAAEEQLRRALGLSMLRHSAPSSES